jgi:hypothetical protein
VRQAFDNAPSTFFVGLNLLFGQPLRRHHARSQTVAMAPRKIARTRWAPGSVSKRRVFGVRGGSSDFQWMRPNRQPSKPMAQVRWAAFRVSGRQLEKYGTGLSETLHFPPRHLMAEPSCIGARPLRQRIVQQDHATTSALASGQIPVNLVRHANKHSTQMAGRSRLAHTLRYNRFRAHTSSLTHASSSV